MSSVDLARETESADILNAIRKHIAENKAGNTSAQGFTPEFIIQFFNSIDISNNVSLNNNKHEFSNQVNVSNAVSVTDLGLVFRVTDDAGNVSSDRPIKMDFWILG